MDANPVLIRADLGTDTGGEVRLRETRTAHAGYVSEEANPRT